MTGLTAADLIGQVELPVLDLKFCTKPGLLLRRRELRDQWGSAADRPDPAASLGQRSDKTVLAEELAQLDEQVSASLATIRVQAIDAAAWAALKAKHPRTDGKVGGFDPDTFAPAALAACAVAPTFTDDEATRFVARLSDGQREQVCGPLIALNEAGFDLPLDVGAYAPSRDGASR